VARLLAGRRLLVAAAAVGLIALVAVAAGLYSLAHQPPARPVVAGPGGPPPAPPAAPLSTLPKPLFNVMRFGAAADGSTDDTRAINLAIAAAAGGGTVYFPAGSYAVGPGDSTGASLKLAGAAAVTFAGAGRDATRLIETAPKDLLSIKTDGVAVQDLTLDTQSHDGRAAIVVVANRTTLQRAKILGGDKAFALFYAGPPGAKPDSATYNTGNQVTHVVVDDRLSDDGFSFSFQSDGQIADIDHTGSRLAIYVDRRVKVSGYRYRPGQQKSAKDGFYVTPPSTAITIQDFVSAGSGGIIGANAKRASNGITITGERLSGRGNRLMVGDVVGLQLTGCDFGDSNWLLFGAAAITETVQVKGCRVPAVRFKPTRGASVSAIAFVNDTYPAFHAPAGKAKQTFVDVNGEPVSYTVSGGRWENTSGGFAKGSGADVQVSGLQGYSG
jgi:hypothetical protein